MMEPNIIKSKHFPKATMKQIKFIEDLRKRRQDWSNPYDPREMTSYQAHKEIQRLLQGVLYHG